MEFWTIVPMLLVPTAAILGVVRTVTFISGDVD
jgi:hypothetical protein